MARGTKEIDAEMVKLRKEREAAHEKLRTLKVERDEAFVREEAERPASNAQEIGAPRPDRTKAIVAKAKRLGRTRKS